MSQEVDFSGIWHSVYHYTSTAKPGTFTSEYDVKIYQAGNQLVIQSVPNEAGSYLLLRLSIDDRILTGTWHEQTSPTGGYKGVTYYGAVQLIIDEDGAAIRGEYVGFNRKMFVQHGKWEIVRTGQAAK